MKHTVEIDVPDDCIVTGHLLAVQYTSHELMETGATAMALEFEGGLHAAIGLAIRASDFLRGIC